MAIQFRSHPPDILGKRTVELVSQERWLGVKLLICLVGNATHEFVVGLTNKRSFPNWELLGGLANQHETVGEALGREGIEEFGFDLSRLVGTQVCQIVAILEHSVDIEQTIIGQVITVMLRVDATLKQAFQTVDRDENQNVTTFTYSELQQIPALYGSHLDILDLAHGNGSIRFQGTVYNRRGNSSLYLPEEVKN